MSLARRFTPRHALAVAALTATSVVVAGVPADAATSLSVKLSEFKVAPAKRSVAHGRVTFDVRNAGTMEHELVVIRTNKKAAQLASGGKASEKGSAGEVELAAGKSKHLTLNLKKGHYALICNVGGHYMAGMHADLTVR
ncbi:MAG TPA: plastocyanin/azurin family copper-binding protein [Baekduia sp.]